MWDACFLEFVANRLIAELLVKWFNVGLCVEFEFGCAVVPSGVFDSPRRAAPTPSPRYGSRTATRSTCRPWSRETGAGAEGLLSDAGNPISRLYSQGSSSETGVVPWSICSSVRS